MPFCRAVSETHERKVSVADNSSFDAAAEIFDALCVKLKGNGGRTDAELFKAFQRKGIENVKPVTAMYFKAVLFRKIYSADVFGRKCCYAEAFELFKLFFEVFAVKVRAGSSP